MLVSGRECAEIGRKAGTYTPVSGVQVPHPPPFFLFMSIS